jgi:hypothetical protein
LREESQKTTEQLIPVRGYLEEIGRATDGESSENATNVEIVY